MMKHMMPPRVAAIVQMVADKYAADGVTFEDLVGQCRARQYSIPRQELYYELYEVRRPDGSHAFSLPRIGKWIGGRDHSSVLHGIRKHKDRLAAQEVVLSVAA